MIKTLPNELQKAIQITLGEKFGKEILLLDFKSVGGGCINSGGRLSTNEGDFFLKWNDAQRFPEMFTKEALGLELLQNTNTIGVPNVVWVGETAVTQFLILDFIESGRPTEVYWRELGNGLASLHKNSSSMFGLDHDNYIGSLIQSNSQADNWIDFFIQSRINPQLKLAVDKGELEAHHVKKFETLFTNLSSLLPVEMPSLLHGDLWNGNIMCNDVGRPFIIDPAVYYGHREMDLAFTYLFGGFDNEFYSSYSEEFPLEPGFDNRVDIYNLYPLLVHVNLFGGSYANQVISILNRFV